MGTLLSFNDEVDRQRTLEEVARLKQIAFLSVLDYKKKRALRFAKESGKALLCSRITAEPKPPEKYITQELPELEEVLGATILITSPVKEIEVREMKEAKEVEPKRASELSGIEYVWIEKELKAFGVVWFRWIGKKETTLSKMRRIS